MKILHVIDFLNSGGAERVCVDLLNLLKKNGHDVSLLLISGEGVLIQQLDPTVDKIKLNRRFKYSLGKLFELAGHFKKYDLIHVHMRHNFRYTSLINLLTKSHKIILHDHSPVVDGGDLRVPLGFKFLTKPKYYIGVSDALTKWAEKQLTIAPSNIFLLENTVANEKYIKPGEKKGLVHVSNIKPGKNQDFVLRLLASSSHSVAFYGQVQDSRYFNQLNKKIETNQLNTRVSFFHGVTSIQRELPKYQLGLHTSVFESGPLVLVEYLTQYLPFVAFDTGNVSKKLRSAFPEFFLDNLDVNEWTDRIDLLLNSTPDMEKMKTVYDKLFSTDIYLNKCLRIYNSVLNY